VGGDAHARGECAGVEAALTEQNDLLQRKVDELTMTLASTKDDAAKNNAAGT
jgi:hypothetical protein